MILFQKSKVQYFMNIYKKSPNEIRNVVHGVFSPQATCG